MHRSPCTRPRHVGTRDEGPFVPAHQDMRTVGVYKAAQRYQSNLLVCGPHPPICFRPERGVHREGGAITVVLATPEGTRPKPPNLVKVEMDMRKWNESFLYFTIYIGDDRFAVEYLETSMSTTGRHFRLWRGLEDGTDHMAVAFPEEVRSPQEHCWYFEGLIKP